MHLPIHLLLAAGLLSDGQLDALSRPPAFVVGDIAAAGPRLRAGGPAAAAWLLPGVTLPAP